jgi:hypothetical protein
VWLTTWLMWATVLSAPPVLRRKITKSERIIDERRSGSGNTPDPDDFMYLARENSVVIFLRMFDCGICNQAPNGMLHTRFW